MKDEGGRMKAEGKTTAASGRSTRSSFIPHPSSLAFIALLGAMNGAGAQVTTDPTRPPPGYAPGDPDLAIQTGGPVLQSVMISAAGRSAIISGEVVKQGQKYRDARLVRVTENEAVLKGPDGTQVLKMYPGVEKRDPAQAKAKAAPRRGTARPQGTEPAAGGSASPR
jgi:MSHA biogenesis protein MshK